MHFKDATREDAEQSLAKAGGIIRMAIGRKPPPVK